MKAKIITGQAPGGARTRLADVLPLATPYVLQFFPIYACNFKCEYCIFKLSREQRGFVSDRIIMDLDFYKTCINDMLEFPSKVKVLRFVGIGEPLLHKDIARMVEYAVEKNIANVVEIITNASLLTPKLSDDLIRAGLSRLVVSIQGTSSEKYFEMSDVDIDFDAFLANLKYFYSHKQNTHVYIKIVDSALFDKEDEQKFYDLFGDICDTIGIEHLVPIHAVVNLDGMVKDLGIATTQFGLPVTDVQVCPQPFFTMQINPDEKVVPCFSFEYPEIMGNCHRQTVANIWNGERFQEFRRMHLSGTRDVCKTCAECNIMKYRMFPEDDLSQDTERLKELYKA